MAGLLLYTTRRITYLGGDQLFFVRTFFYSFLKFFQRNHLRATSSLVVLIYVANLIHFLPIFTPTAEAVEGNVLQQMYEVGRSCQKSMGSGDQVGQQIEIFNTLGVLPVKGEKSPYPIKGSELPWYAIKDLWKKSRRIHLFNLAQQHVKFAKVFGRSSMFGSMGNHPLMQESVEAVEHMHEKFPEKDPRPIITSEQVAQEFGYINTRIARVNQVCERRNKTYKKLLYAYQHKEAQNPLVNPEITTLLTKKTPLTGYGLAQAEKNYQTQIKKEEEEQKKNVSSIIKWLTKGAKVDVSVPGEVVYHEGVGMQLPLLGDMGAQLRARIQEEKDLAALDTYVDRLLIQSSPATSFLLTRDFTQNHAEGVPTNLLTTLGEFSSADCVERGVGLHSLPTGMNLTPSIGQVEKNFEQQAKQYVKEEQKMANLPPQEQIVQMREDLTKMIEVNPTPVQFALFSNPNVTEAKVVCHLIQQQSHKQRRTEVAMVGVSMAMLLLTPALILGVGSTITMGGLKFMTLVNGAMLVGGSVLFGNSLLSRFKSEDLSSVIRNGILAGEIPSLQGSEMIQKLQNEKPTYGRMVLQATGVVLSAISTVNLFSAMKQFSMWNRQMNLPGGSGIVSSKDLWKEVPANQAMNVFKETKPAMGNVKVQPKVPGIKINPDGSELETVGAGSSGFGKNPTSGGGGNGVAIQKQTLSNKVVTKSGNIRKTPEVNIPKVNPILNSTEQMANISTLDKIKNFVAGLNPFTKIQTQNDDEEKGDLSAPDHLSTPPPDENPQEKLQRAKRMIDGKEMVQLEYLLQIRQLLDSGYNVENCLKIIKKLKLVHLAKVFENVTLTKLSDYAKFQWLTFFSQHAFAYTKYDVEGSYKKLKAMFEQIRDDATTAFLQDTSNIALEKLEEISNRTVVDATITTPFISSDVQSMHFAEITGARHWGAYSDKFKNGQSVNNFQNSAKIDSENEKIDEARNQSPTPIFLSETDLDPMTEKGRENICRALKITNLRMKALELMVRHNIDCNDMPTIQAKKFLKNYRNAINSIKFGILDFTYISEICELSLINNDIGHQAQKLLETVGTNYIDLRLDKLKSISNREILLYNMNYFAWLISTFDSNTSMLGMNLSIVYKKIPYFKNKFKSDSEISTAITEVLKIIEFQLFTRDSESILTNETPILGAELLEGTEATKHNDINLANIGPALLPGFEKTNENRNPFITRQKPQKDGSVSNHWTPPPLIAQPNSIDQVLYQNIPMYMLPNVEIQTPADRTKRAEKAIRLGLIDFGVIDEICKILENKNNEYRSMTINIDRYQENHPYIEHMCMIQKLPKNQGNTNNSTKNITSESGNDRQKRIQNKIRSKRQLLARETLENPDLPYNPELKAEICEISLMETDPLANAAHKMIEKYHIDCIREKILSSSISESSLYSNPDFQSFSDEEKKQIHAMYKFTIEHMNVSNNANSNPIKFSLEVFSLVNRMLKFKSDWGTWARLVYCYQHHLPIGDVTKFDFTPESAEYKVMKIHEFSKFDDALGVEARNWILTNDIQSRVRFSFPTMLANIYYPITLTNDINFEITNPSLNTEDEVLLRDDIHTSLLYSLLLESTYMTSRDIEGFISSITQVPEKIEYWTRFLRVPELGFEKNSEMESFVRFCTLIYQMMKAKPNLHLKFADAFQMYLRLNFGFKPDFALDLSDQLMSSTFSQKISASDMEKLAMDDLLDKVRSSGITTRHSEDFFKNNLTHEQRKILDRFFMNLNLSKIFTPHFFGGAHSLEDRLKHIKNLVNDMNGIKNEDPGIKALSDQLMDSFIKLSSKYNFIYDQQTVKDETYKLLYYIHQKQLTAASKTQMESNLRALNTGLGLIYENLPLDILLTLTNSLDKNFIFGIRSDGKTYKETELLSLGLDTSPNESIIFENINALPNSLVFQTVYDVHGNEIDKNMKEVVIKNENGVPITYTAVGNFESNSKQGSDVATKEYGFYLIRKKLAPYYLQPSILLQFLDKKIFLEKNPKKSELKMDYTEMDSQTVKLQTLGDLEDIVLNDLQHPSIDEKDREIFERKIDFGIVQYNSPDEIFLYDLLLSHFRKLNEIRILNHENIWQNGIKLKDLPIILKSMHSTFQIGYRRKENIDSLKTFLNHDFTDLSKNFLDQMIAQLTNQSSSSNELSPLDIVQMYYPFHNINPDKNKKMQDEAITIIISKLKENKAFVYRLQNWSDDQIRRDLSNYLSENEIKILLENKKELLNLATQ